MSSVALCSGQVDALVVVSLCGVNGSVVVCEYGVCMFCVCE